MAVIISPAHNSASPFAEMRGHHALTTLVERGLIKPVIGAVLPLARTGEAHELLESGGPRGLRGKAVIDVVGQTVQLPRRDRSLYDIGMFPQHHRFRDRRRRKVTAAIATCSLKSRPSGVHRFKP